MPADADVADPSPPVLASPAPAKRRPGRSHWGSAWRTLSGGATTAIVSFSVAAPVGTLAIAPLGADYTAHGVVMGLTAAIFGGMAAALATRLPVMKSGPITATALLWTAALLQVLPAARDPDSVSRAIVLACLCVIMAGAMQVAMGMLRLGSAIKYVPYPVVAGFRNGIGVLMLVSQVPVLIGTPHSLGSMPWSRIADEMHPANMVVGVLVALAMWLLRRTRLRMLAPFLAIVAGTALYYLLNALAGVQSTSVVGALPPYGVWLERFVAAMAPMDTLTLLRDLAALLPHAASIAIVASIFALLGAKVVDQATHTRHDGNRELVAQGLGNIGAGAFGGIPISGLPSQSLLAFRGGAGTRAASLVACLVQLALLEFAAPWIGRIPAATFAGVMIVTGIDLIDDWSVHLLANLRRRDTHRPTIATDLAIVVLVTALIVAGRLVSAVVLGILIAAVVFVSRMSRQVVRQRSSGNLRHSRRRRSEAAMQRLRECGERIVVFELEGPLFFGTADRLATDVDKFATAAFYVILDLRRVNAIDATGARILQHIADAAARRGARVVFSAISPHGPNRHLLRELVSAPSGEPTWFPDIDHALEWCEDRLLAETHGAEAGDEIAFVDVDLCHGLDADERAALEAAMERSEHARGTTLFKRGDEGDRLFVLLKGSLSLSIGGGDTTGNRRRLLTLHAGVTFGEMALLEGKPRSADAVFDADAVTLALSREAFDALALSRPRIANRLLLTLARILAAHLRATTEELRELER